MRKVPEFAPFPGQSLGGFGSFLRSILPVFIMFPLRGRGLLRKEFLCVFAAENGTYFRRSLEGVCPSMPTSTGRPEGFLRNAESAESAGIFAILGKTRREFRHFHNAYFASFYHVSA